MEQNLFTKPSEKNTIPVAEAVEWTTNWRDWAAKQGVPTEEILKAFTIPFSDIINLSKFPVEGLIGVRAYLSLTNPDDITTIKLCLVPVSKDNKDILHYPKTENEPGEGEDDSAVYDLTYPCPHFCDADSKLAGG